MSEDAPDPTPPETPPVRLPKLVTLKIIGAVIFIICLPLDLWSKSYMQDKLGLVEGTGRSEHAVDVIPGFLAWEGTWNAGATFGYFSGYTIMLLSLTSIATLGLLVWFLGTKATSRCLHVGLALILSGAVGNLRDRWQWGEVRDFILVYLGDLEDRWWDWPNFNIADSCIVVGVILVLWDAIFGFGAKRAREKALARKAAAKGAANSKKAATS